MTERVIVVGRVHVESVTWYLKDFKICIYWDGGTIGTYGSVEAVCIS